VGARITGASDFARREAATCVCCFEEGEEDGGYANDGLRVNGKSAGPTIPASRHGISELFNGFGLVYPLATLRPNDTGIVDQYVNVSSLLLNLCYSGFHRLEVCHIAGYGGENRSGGLGRRGGRFEGLDGVLKDVEATAENVDFCCAILIQSGRDCKADTCYGKSPSDVTRHDLWNRCRRGMEG
jgi:hypothetical protein